MGSAADAGLVHHGSAHGSAGAHVTPLCAVVPPTWQQLATRGPTWRRLLVTCQALTLHLGTDRHMYLGAIKPVDVDN